MEESDEVKLLETNEGTYIDENLIIDSQNIPEFTEEESDDREYEKIEENSEGGL